MEVIYSHLFKRVAFHRAIQGDVMAETPISTRAQSLRIFLVENHPDTLRYLKIYLEGQGHLVLTARSKEAALQELPDANCDVLLSDIGLPDGDGWSLLREVHLPRPIYGIAMSGFGMNADQIRSRNAGYRHHLLKPFKPNELDSMLAEASRELSASE